MSGSKNTTERAESLQIPTKQVLDKYRLKYEQELFEYVIPFWEKHSPDEKHGGYFNCLDRDGKVYDFQKHVWLQGRQVWLFAKLFEAVQNKPVWLEIARQGIEFLRKFAVRDDDRVYFSLAADGRPTYLQRKIFSECFYIMALAQFARISNDSSMLQEAKNLLEKVWSWAYDWSRVGRPDFSGSQPLQQLAVPMILLNLIEEVAGDNPAEYSAEVDDCIRRIQMHVHSEKQMVLEHVMPDGQFMDSSAGRLVNPGHAIEAGWFMQHWAKRLHRGELSDLAVNMVRWSHTYGWDDEFGGLYYFLDTAGHSPVQLEWQMKLWWPHCEALYAHLLDYSLSADSEDWHAFQTVDQYIFKHFVDHQYGEWFGYLDRQGNVTHRFKGGPYKGCFHVPRALLFCWQLLRNWPEKA